MDEVVIARFLQITPRRVLEMARDGEFPAHPIGRGPRKTWRFRISEINAHFSAKENTSGATLKVAVPGATRRKQNAVQIKVQSKFLETIKVAKTAASN